MWWMGLFLANFGLTMFCLALILSLINRLFKRKATSTYGIVYRWVALLAVGVTGIFTFSIHAFFPEFGAATLGWANSPFQFEVGIADLAFGLLGILSFYPNYGFRVATVIGNTFWLWGNAVGHLYQLFAHHNFTLGNAGSWLWMDILIPFVLIYSIVKLRPPKPEFPRNPDQPQSSSKFLRI